MTPSFPFRQECPWLDNGIQYLAVPDGWTI